MEARETVVQIEFYGIPRVRAGVGKTSVTVSHHPARLGDVISRLAFQFPELAAECFLENSLRRGFVASVDGSRFITASGTEITGTGTLLILSADAGG